MSISYRPNSITCMHTHSHKAPHISCCGMLRVKGCTAPARQCVTCCTLSLLRDLVVGGMYACAGVFAPRCSALALTHVDVPDAGRVVWVESVPMV